MIFADETSVPISALQHWLYCPRQCALIHVERLWAENRFTAEGRILHKRADAGGGERRKSVKILHGVEIASRQHGLHGTADVVELHGQPPVPFPVEYKRGRPKTHRADEVQLCAQALCLEEMFSCRIDEGALFYGKTRHRKQVVFDGELRELTCATARDVRRMIETGHLPPPRYEKRRCDACSLQELCLPKARRNPAAWLKRVIISDTQPT